MTCITSEVQRRIVLVVIINNKFSLISLHGTLLALRWIKVQYNLLHTQNNARCSKLAYSACIFISLPYKANYQVS